MMATPAITLPMAQSTIAARLASGGATDATVEEIKTLLNIFPGSVNMVRTAPGGSNPVVDPATWVVFNEVGGLVDLTGTTSQGLQEAINYAEANGLNLYVDGGGLIPEIPLVNAGGTLGTNPFATTISSSTVVVTHTTHGFTTGILVRYFGITGAINGIPEAEFEDSAGHAVTVLDPNSYTITLTTNATSTGSGGGSSVVWNQKGQDGSIILCTAGIVFPQMQIKHIQINACTMQMAGSGTSAVEFNSIMASSIIWNGGQIVVQAGWTNCVHFNPKWELPSDPNGPIITASTIKLPSVVGPAGSTLIHLDCTNGAISQNDFLFIEPNGGATGVKVTQDTAGGTKLFRGNNVTAIGTHAQTTRSYQIGVSTTNAALIRGNFFDLHCDPGNVSEALQIWGIENTFQFTCSDTEGTAAIGIRTELSAKDNNIRFGQLEATIPISDGSSDNSNIFIGGRIAASVHRNGVAQTGVVSNVWTKIEFTTSIYDAGDKFDGATNHRWIPGIVGLVSIKAQITYTVITDNTYYGIAVYKNGSVLKQSVQAGSGTVGEQGPTITVEDLVTTTTDFYEIFTRQISGSDKIIDGGSTRTYAMFKKIG